MEQEDLLTFDQLEVGMYYTRTTSNQLIIKTLTEPDKGSSIRVSLVLETSMLFHPDHNLGHGSGTRYRKATIQEEIYLEECIKATKFMKLDEALASFQKRFPTPEAGKRFRIGYVDKHGITRNRVVPANDVESAIKEIPDFESMNYSTEL